MAELTLGTIYILGVFSYGGMMDVNGLLFDIRQASVLGNPLLNKEQRKALFGLSRDGKKKARLELVKRYREEVIPYWVNAYDAYRKEAVRIRKADAMAVVPKMNDHEKAGKFISEMLSAVKLGKSIYLNGDNLPDPCHGSALKGYIHDTLREMGLMKEAEKVAEKKSDSPFKAFNLSRFKGKK